MPFKKKTNKFILKESYIKKLPLMTVVFLLLVTVCFACDFGDALIDTSSADARTLLPILASDTASSSITGLIFNGLVKYDKDINLVGDLARSWEISSDKREITFHLRENVYWHDGEQFSAEDVKFTYEKLIDPQVRTPYSGDFERINKVEIVDSFTIKVSYKQPFSPGLSSWGMSIMPKHILKDHDLNNTEFSRNPIGTGPYRFKKWITQEKIELVANKDYFEGSPFISRIITRIIPDSDTLFLELQTKNVDWMSLTPLQFKKKTNKDFFKNNFNKFRTQAFQYTYLGYNLNDVRFKDKRVRQALNYAVDKQELINGVLLGFGRVCTGPFIPESWAYNDKVADVEFNPKKAKIILKQAGWSDTDSDGIIDKNNEPFEFTLITNQGNDLRIRSAEIIQRRLADIGIKMKIKVIEWSSFLSEFIDKRRF